MQRFNNSLPQTPRLRQRAVIRSGTWLSQHDLWLAILCAWLWVSGSGFADSQSFQFAFLSDTHVGATTGEEDLRAAVRDINSITGLSFVVLSGDITEYGSLQQLRLAHQILSEIKIPVHIIPGNHDTKWSESGATDFPKLWGKDRFEFEQGGIRFIGMHEGPLMKMGDGHWSPQDVRWLEQTLRQLADRNQPIVFVTHYPIDDGIANWFVVLDLLKQYNTQVVLCGHGHRNRAMNFEGVPGVMGRSNLRGQATSGGFNVVEIKDGKMSFAERHPGGETQAPWTTVALEQHDYAALANKTPRPDFSANSRYPQVRERWQFKTGWTIAASPTLWKDSAIIGDASGTVSALSLTTGNVQWKFPAPGAVYSTPEAEADRVVFGCTDGCVYALKTATGTEAWKYQTDRPIVASPRIADGVVYIGSSEGKFRALDLRDGHLLWEFGGLRGFVETRPLVEDGKVIFGAWDQHLYALETKTGALAWTWKGDRQGALLSPAACWPVAAEGKVFIVAPDRRMTAIDVKTGRQIWRTGNFMVRETIGLSADQSRFYVRSMQDLIYAFSTSAAQPEKVWERNAGFGYDINSGMIAEKDGVMFYGTKNGLLIALDGKTGDLKWQHKVGVGVVNTVVPLSGKEVLATDFDGKVVLVSAQN